ncbi:MAG TPA: VOC family protein [Candidatus Saccharimonadales bacterium]|nr:VOC family protein [Candidatus Saccharimonadales bacterium]
MWGKPPFSIDDNCAIDVRDLATARQWYEEKLGLRRAKLKREDDSGRPFVDLQLSDTGGLLTLVELRSGAQPQHEHVIFNARNLEKTMAWLKDREVTVEPITRDSGGNESFHFIDLDGNRIEVCLEPGKKRG